MKSVLIVFFTIVSIGFGFAQKKGQAETPSNNTSNISSSNDAEYNLQKTIALMALKYNDATVAKNSLYKMIALKPERTDLIDSLAFLYYQMGAFTECILVSRELLEKDPEKMGILEVKAISEQNLGLSKLALEDYEKLYPKSKSIYHLYQIAGLQYDLKRFGECNLSIQALMANEKLKESKIQVFIGQGQSQEVGMEAGVYNMLGMILLNLNNEAEAKEKFKKSVELAPEFILPKNNLAALEKQKTK